MATNAQSNGNQAIAPGALETQFQTVDRWIQDIQTRLQTAENRFQNMMTNDPVQDARRLNALRVLNNIRGQINNSNFYVSQQGNTPYFFAKTLESQLNSFGYSFLPGIWRTARCGSGMFWHMCGRISEANG